MNEFIEGSGPRSKRGADPTPKGWYYYNTGGNPVHNRCGHYLLPPNPEGVTDQTSKRLSEFLDGSGPRNKRGPDPNPEGVVLL